MTQLTVNLPAVLTVDLKDFASQTVETAKFNEETIRNLVRFALKVHLERRKNAGGEKATEADRREAVAKAVAELNAGTFELKAGAAAKLTEKEEIFRKLLAEAFEKKGDCKKTDAANYARVANRFELYTDLVVKRQLLSMGVQKSKEEMEAVTKNHFFLYDTKAENIAEASRQAREGMTISFA